MKEKHGKKHDKDGKKFKGEFSREDMRSHKGGEGHKRKGGHHGAKTFRRGRALEFLERLHVKRATLLQQLETPELQTINSVLVGELKAVETIIQEFVHVFEIQEEEVQPQPSLPEEAETTEEVDE